jgi:sugar lactone lactonase YvrE
MRAAHLIPAVLLLVAECCVAQPVITSQPISQTWWTGDTVSFAVAASGAGPLTYQWQLNRTNIPNYIISTFAGGGAGDGIVATNASLSGPTGLALDAAGDLFIADPGEHRVRKVGLNGIITTVAGNGAEGYGLNDSGDGNPATEIALGNPMNVAVDSSGNLFIAELIYGGYFDFGRVRKVSTNGIISTVAGGGVNAHGDGANATNVAFRPLYSIAVDVGGNLFVGEDRVYRVSTNGIISSVAGGGTNYPGNGGLATNAQLNAVHGLAADAFGNLFIADTFNNRICKVDTNGLLSTVAGNGTFGYCGDGGAATNASLANPSGLALDLFGNLFFLDVQDNSVRRVSTNGLITTVAGYGNPTNTFYGDGGAATNAGLALGFASLAFDSAGNLFIADTGNNRVRRVDTSEIITTVAGGGTGFSGDGGAATNASLASPHAVAFDESGNLFIADTSNNRISRVDAEGIITTVAGNGSYGSSGDGGAATNASLAAPSSIAFDRLGNLFIADTGNNRISKVDTKGVITSVAGGSTNGFFGDGGLATNAILNSPQGVALDGFGNLFIADSGNNRIRKVDLNSIITTVAGGDTNGFSGDGGPATNATLAYPLGIASDDAGNIFIADSSNNRIRRVDTNGIITTVAGGGKYGGYMNGDPAILNSPAAVGIDGFGNLFIADTWNNRIRMVTPSGIIDTVVGGGVNTYLGDGGPAYDAILNSPHGVAVDASGKLFIADTFDNRIRKVADSSSPLLVVNNAQGVNAGNYQVIVSAPSGSVTSRVATLNVTSTPLIFEPRPPSGGAFTANFLSRPGSANVLFSTTNLNPPVFWQPIAMTLAGADGTWQFTGTNPANSRTRFFRSITDWQPWVQASIPVASSWLSVAASADGTRLIAAGYPGYPWNYDPWTGPPNANWAQTKIAVSSVMASLYLSSDSGATWTRSSASSNYWISVSSSADGTKLAAVATDYQQGQPGAQTSHTYGAIYVSTNSGATWTRTAAPSISWNASSAVAISADGTKMAAITYYGGGRVYTSADLGASWVWRTGLIQGTVLGAIALSADGKIIVTGEATSSNVGGPIHISRDGGATWTTTSAISNIWSSIACSADGQKLVAATGYGYGNLGPIYISTDSGLTWTQSTTPNRAWSSVTSSQDGTRLVAAAYDGSVYISTDSGSNWASAFAPGEIWSSVAWSDNGNHVTAVSVGGTISSVRFPLGLYSR